MKERVVVFAAVLVGFVLANQIVTTRQTGGYQDLVRLHQEIVQSRAAGRGMGGGVSDYSPTAIEAQKKHIGAFRQRLVALDADSWPIPQKVDYMLVWAALNQLDFNLNVLRSWERDPAHYVEIPMRLAFMDLPPPERLPMFQMQLKNIPKILQQARTNLTRPSGEFARFAIRDLERSGGVNNREPRRPVMPDGVIAWYRDMLEQATKRQPELVEDIKLAIPALESYRDWLKQNHTKWTEPGRIGLERYSWYLKNVKLLPIGVDDIRRIGQVEWDRTRTFLAIEQQKNKINNVPDPPMASSEAELRAKVKEAEVALRAFISKYRLLTIPSDFPAEFESEARWIVRPDGSRNFWERHVYRDPTQIHIHSAVPGHHFEGMMQERLTSPIRKVQQVRDTVNAEGWAVYLEEMFLQAGLLDNRPRARERAYIAQLFRAVRVPAELNMQTGTWTYEDAIKFWMDEIPMMEPNLAWQDATHGLRRPTELVNTATGKWQLEHLLADRMRQLGDKFDLGEFHDQVLKSGIIPWSLIRWEMTGLDDEIKGLWQEARKSSTTQNEH